MLSEHFLKVFWTNNHYRQSYNDFQDRLKNDLAKIRGSDKIFMSADKTGNTYKISKLAYDTLIKTEIHKG